VIEAGFLAIRSKPPRNCGLVPSSGGPFVKGSGWSIPGMPLTLALARGARISKIQKMQSHLVGGLQGAVRRSFLFFMARFFVLRAWIRRLSGGRRSWRGSTALRNRSRTWGYRKQRPAGDVTNATIRANHSDESLNPPDNLGLGSAGKTFSGNSYCKVRRAGKVPDRHRKIK